MESQTTEQNITISNNHGVTRELHIIHVTETDYIYDDYNSYPEVESFISEVYYKGVEITDKLSYDFIQWIEENYSF